MMRNAADHQGACHLEHQADGRRSGAGRHPPGRPDLRLRCAAAGRQVHGQPDACRARRYGGQPATPSPPGSTPETRSSCPAPSSWSTACQSCRWEPESASCGAGRRKPARLRSVCFVKRKGKRRTLFVDFFIRRPVFATVCALLIILAGAICIPNLPISMYPNAGPAAGGRHLQLCGRQRRHRREGRHHPARRSHQRRRGHALHQLLQHQQRHQLYHHDLPNRLQPRHRRRRRAEPRSQRAPAACPPRSTPPASRITKANSNFVFGAGFFTRDGRYSHEFISNYLDVYVKDALKRVPGVGDVQIFGERKYAMRIWLDPAKLAARGLTATDVVNALTEQNVEIPAGQLGQPPSDSTQAFQIPVRVVGRLSSPEEFDNIIVKNNRQRPRAAAEMWATAEVGAEDYSSSLEYNGLAAQGIGVLQLANANALDVDAQGQGRAQRTLQELSARTRIRSRVRLDHRRRRLHSRSPDHARLRPSHRHHRHLPLPARLARHHHPRRHHSGLAHRHLRLHQALRLLHQLAHPLRHHPGHGPRRRRRHRRHRKRAAPYRHGALRPARGHVERHG